MKKLLSILLVFLFVLGGVACDRQNPDGDKTEAPSLWETEEDVMKPFWISEKIKDESILLVKSGDGQAEGNLLFSPREIISVCSYDVVNNKRIEYVNGEDYVVEGKTIKAITDTMPYMTDKQLSGEDELVGFDYSQIPSTDTGLHLPFTEGSGFVVRQIYVTYSYEEKWDGEVPNYAGETLSKSISKLKNKEEFNLMIYGDSISTGANSTSILKIYPYAESWPNALCSNLEKIYETKINFLNKSVGGWTSENAIKSSGSIGWVGGQQITQKGISGTLEELPDYMPDLVVIGFGMNDATLGINRKNFKLYINRIMTTIRKRNPDCEFILVGTMLANPKALNQSKNQIEYFNELQALANENKGVAAVNVGAMHRDILAKGKKYADMTGNNVNHPNDFMASVYAMNLLSVLVK